MSDTVTPVALGSALSERLPDDRLGTLRRNALAKFVSRGFPTQRDEDWKYTDLSEVVDISERWAASPVRPEHADAETIRAIQAEIDAHWIVISNGRLLNELTNFSTADGIALDTIKGGEPLSFDDRLADLNTALFVDGVRIAVDARYAADKPLGILVADAARSADQFVQTRVEIALADNAAVEIVEIHTSAGDRQHYENALVNLEIGGGARVDYVRLQDRAPGHSHTARLNVLMRRDSTFNHSGIDVGAKLARNDLHIDIAEPGATARFDGLYIVADGQHVDNHTRVDHRSGPATSSQEYRGILHGRCRAVWNGKAIVHKGADGTDAEQANHNLLLSENCEIDAKPELEIYADEVKCSHGTTVGQLDENALFYLRTRGLDRQSAEQALIRAFATTIADGVPVAAVHDYAMLCVEARLGAITRGENS